jgi:hypothetical protein
VRRTFVTLAALVALAAAGCGGGGNDEQVAAAPPQASSQAPPQVPLAELTVRVDPDGGGAKQPRTVDVTCDGQGDAEVCGVVAHLTADKFTPTDSQLACTQQYGGPETATVTGTLRGEQVQARFSRENGCEISRWQDVQELLGVAA